MVIKKIKIHMIIYFCLNIIKLHFKNLKESIKKSQMYFQYFRSLDAEIPQSTLNRWKKRARIQEESLRSNNEYDHGIREYQKSDDNNDNGYDDEDEDQNTFHSVYEIENNDEFDLQNEDEDVNEDLKSIKELLKKDDKDYSELDLYDALLSLFFSCKISQAAFQ
jgi:hypothetical protein